MAPPVDIYDPGYALVMTEYPGMVTGRSRIAADGGVALDKRNRIDAVVTATGWAIDPNEKLRAIPWVSRPFQIWVSSPVNTQASVHMVIRAEKGRVSAIEFSTDRTGTLPTVARGSQICVPITLERGRTVVTVAPRFAAAIQPPARASVSDRLPPPPKVLGIAGLTVGGAGTCGS
jgi:hypothetical protein